MHGMKNLKFLELTLILGISYG